MELENQVCGGGADKLRTSFDLKRKTTGKIVHSSLLPIGPYVDANNATLHDVLEKIFRDFEIVRFDEMPKAKFEIVDSSTKTKKI